MLDLTHCRRKRRYTCLETRLRSAWTLSPEIQTLRKMAVFFQLPSLFVTVRRTGLRFRPIIPRFFPNTIVRAPSKSMYVDRREESAIGRSDLTHRNGSSRPVKPRK